MLVHMRKEPASHRTWLRAACLRLCRLHFGLLILYGVLVGVYDSAHLMAPDIIMKRSVTFGILLVANTALWYAAHKEVQRSSYYKWLIYGVVLIDLVLATASVYTDRGVASRDVALFALPIISAAVLVNRSAIYGTAFLSLAAYVAVSMRYYFLHPNEMLHVEIYGMLVFHSAIFLAVASLLWVVVRARK